ncbi:MAG: PilZ domain-containing protein [Deltaproteobacteria bacterium]|nr:PilZ domain-containing protein [Deltaproteobacteria bacterium]MBW1920594.1 PilZ domain-containing protein [Deltaproteobacteria bacterium]MBW1935565.1 PilZ domain-containing protein [Deltaproteobacteria bacterium]
MAEETNRRRFDRKSTLNLVDYVILGERGEQLGRGMGRTRNVSLVGLLLETYSPLQPKQRVMITIGLADDTIELKGQVVHVETSPPEKRHYAGVAFIEMAKEAQEMLKRYIEALENEKNEPGPPTGK